MVYLCIIVSQCESHKQVKRNRGEMFICQSESRLKSVDNLCSFGEGISDSTQSSREHLSVFFIVSGFESLGDSRFSEQERVQESVHKGVSEFLHCEFRSSQRGLLATCLNVSREIVCAAVHDVARSCFNISFFVLIVRPCVVHDGLELAGELLRSQCVQQSLHDFLVLLDKVEFHECVQYILDVVHGSIRELGLEDRKQIRGNDLSRLNGLRHRRREGKSVGDISDGLHWEFRSALS